MSYLEALGRLRKPVEARVLILDLSLTSEDLIEDRLLEFRRQVRRERYWDQTNLRSFLLQLRVALQFAADEIAEIKNVITRAAALEAESEALTGALGAPWCPPSALQAWTPRAVPVT